MTMAKVKVSEKMQRAVRMIQSRIGNPPNQGYQNLSFILIMSDPNSPHLLQELDPDLVMQGLSFCAFYLNATKAY